MKQITRSKYHGKKFGRLTILASYMSKTAGGNKRVDVKVRCDCGAEYLTALGHAVYTVHPMCLACRRRYYAEQGRRGFRHPQYKVWRAMILRCHAPRDPVYDYYGARGITVCERWLGNRLAYWGKKPVHGSIDGFHNFIADMGPCPSKKHSLDRLDNDGPYSPENCRWATKAEQNLNKRRRHRHCPNCGFDMLSLPTSHVDSKPWALAIPSSSPSKKPSTKTS